MRVVATAGHVDHGKSLLLARLTDMEPDRWVEERRRGLTIDLGYVWTTLDGPDGEPVTVAFVDVPGHDHFLPNMLCGVGVVDRALLVVAADDGWSAQSEEHLQILDLLGVHGALVAVTKIDLVDEAQVAQVVADVTQRLASTTLADAPVLSVDSLSGRGFDELAGTLAARLADVPPVAADGPARLWVDRVFTIRGAGTVATGMLVDGTLRVEQPLVALPGGRRLRVRGLQRLGEPVEHAQAGSRVAVNLGGVEVDDLDRGAVLVGLGADGRPEGLVTDELDVEVTALPHATIDRTGAWHLHLGTAARAVRVVPLLGAVEPGQRGVVRLQVDPPVPARIGERFVLRESGRRTVAGGGTVLDPDPGSRPRGPERRLEHALRMEELTAADTPAGGLRPLVDAHGGVRALTSLRASAGIGVEQLRPRIDAAGLVVLADHVLAPSTREAWLAAIEHAAERTDAPDRAVPADRLADAAADAGCPTALRKPLLDAAVADGRLVGTGGRYVHRTHAATYDAARRDRQLRLVARLARDGLNLPDPDLAAAEVGIAPFEVQALIDARELLVCGPLLVPPATLQDAVAQLRAGPGRGGAPFTAAEARDAWATSRRCAVPLLEHLAATGVTRFDGDAHRLVDGPGHRVAGDPARDGVDPARPGGGADR